MHAWALDYLRCPQTGSRLTLKAAKEQDGEILAGQLVSEDAEHHYPIVDGVPRFVAATSYCDSFGLQWNKYSRLRSDRYNGTSLIRDTILARTGWTPSHLQGKTLLECGCGCGNDTEVLLELGAERIIAFDLSNSVNAAYANNRDPRVSFVQADIYQVPVQRHAFDVVFCHRMIQHTPDPERSFASIANYVRPGGEVLLHSYDRHWPSMLHWKYLLRPVTKRLSGPTLMRFLQMVGPPLYGIQNPLLRRFGANRYLNYVIARMIPFYNYAHIYRAAGACLTDRELFEVSLLDTFDALAPMYDNPNYASTIVGWFERAGLGAIEVTTRDPVFVKAKAPIESSGIDAAHAGAEQRGNAARRPQLTSST